MFCFLNNFIAEELYIGIISKNSLIMNSNSQLMKNVCFLPDVLKGIPKSLEEL